MQTKASVTAHTQTQRQDASEHFRVTDPAFVLHTWITWLARFLCWWLTWSRILGFFKAHPGATHPSDHTGLDWDVILKSVPVTEIPNEPRTIII